MTGRPNIYILFLYKCITEHLEPNGIIAFIIPTSLYNCLYYQPMRNYIHKHMTILHLETLCKPGFFETGQETMLIVLQKEKRNDDYIFMAKDTIYLSPFYKELREITKNTTTLSELGFGVKTGNVVWNQVKDHLIDNEQKEQKDKFKDKKNKTNLLIYSSNITNCELKLNNLRGEKKQYVLNIDKPTLNGPVILVERGYGNSFHFNFVVTEEQDFYAENHINVIYPLSKEAAKKMDWIVKSFKDERHINFIRWFLGNGSMPASDLQSMIPIFI